MSPWLLGSAGVLYGVTATVAGAMMLSLAWRLRRAADAKATDRLAKRLFGFSLSYLFVLFAVLLVDHWVAPFVTAGLGAIGLGGAS
jgi:protoheme IX farnesyltransferase